MQHLPIYYLYMFHQHVQTQLTLKTTFTLTGYVNMQEPIWPSRENPNFQCVAISHLVFQIE